MKIKNHIVYSTKGGCGKTTFSYWLAHAEHRLDVQNNIEFAFGSNNDFEFIENNPKTLLANVHSKCKSEVSVNCLIDLDLLGSSSTRSFGIQKQIDKNEIITLQALINGHAKPNEITLWKHNIDDAKKLVFVIPVDAQEKEKQIFYNKRNNTPLLRFEEITAHLEYIQKGVELYLKSKGFNDNDTLNFIYDLPLNADGYTEAILDEIFKYNKDSINKDNIQLYLVSNCESMLGCNIDWLNRFLGTYQKRQCDVIIVHNDNIKNDNLNKTNLINEKTTVDIVNKIYCCDDALKSIKYFIGNKNEISIETFKLGADVSISIGDVFNKPIRIDCKSVKSKENSHE